MKNKQKTIQREDIVNVANSIGKNMSDKDIEYVIQEYSKKESDEDIWYILVEDIIYSLNNH